MTVQEAEDKYVDYQCTGCRIRSAIMNPAPTDKARRCPECGSPIIMMAPRELHPTLELQEFER